MSRTILVPYDGSPNSRRALPFAAAFATHGDPARIILLTLLPTSDTSKEAASKSPSDIERAATQQLRAATKVLGDLGVIRVECEVDWARDTSDRILAVAAENRASLIVLGTRGRSGIGRAMVGSVALNLMQSAPMPCAFVPPGAPRPDDRLDTALLAVDGSELTDAAIAYARSLAAARVKVTVLRAVNPVADIMPIAIPGAEGYVPIPHEDMVAAARAQLDAVVATFPAGTATSAIVYGRPADAILDYAAQAGSDIIIMSTRGRSGFGRAVMGSVADSVVRTSKVPVVVVRPSE